MKKLMRRGLKAAFFAGVCYYVYHVIHRFNNDSEEFYLQVIKAEMK